MPSQIKSKEDIAKIREGGQIIHKILREVAAHAKPGVTTLELDTLAEDLIIKAGGIPAFKNFGPKEYPFPFTLCTSINSAVVHGMPSKEAVLKEGDILGLDIGMKYKGMYTDTAITVPIGNISKEAQRLLDVTKEALNLAIKEVKEGNKVGDIAAATQKHIEKNGFSVVRQLTGHGVGYGLHEDPEVPGFGKAGTGPVLKEGMVLAIEPMATAGDYRLKYDEDGWTISTVDGSLGAQFEHTIAVTKNGAEILT
jgi:methionyl aminopeptidase